MAPTATTATTTPASRTAAPRAADAHAVRRPKRLAPVWRTRRRRRAVLWWASVGVATVVTWSSVNAALTSAARAQRRWGVPREVLVASAAIPAGSPLAGRVAVRRWPAAMIPAGALGAAPPDGQVAARDIVAGEVVVAARVSRTAAAGPAGLVPAGWRALVVPLAVPGLPARPGDRVDLAATDTEGILVAAAVVIEARAERLLVAVPADSAAGVAAALGRGPLAVLLRGPG
ncbi:MAG: hypothetical protein HYX34_08070 [Actinobacteria bacterium]|nr:hypothetical protein [Actinomycetota bacterium]